MCLKLNRQLKAEWKRKIVFYGFFYFKWIGIKNGNKKCCFIRHRKIPNDVSIEKSVRDVIEMLILKENVRIFNFGSRSDFDTLCHSNLEKLIRI